MTELTLKDVEAHSNQWVSQRSIGNKEQDIDCKYDYEMGMRAAYTILTNRTVK